VNVLDRDGGEGGLGHGVVDARADRVVASHLPAEAGVTLRRRWSAEEWLAYLRWAGREAQARGVEPDAVAMAAAYDG